MTPEDALFVTGWLFGLFLLLSVPYTIGYFALAAWNLYKRIRERSAV